MRSNQWIESLDGSHQETTWEEKEKDDGGREGEKESVREGGESGRKELEKREKVWEK